MPFKPWSNSGVARIPFVGSEASTCAQKIQVFGSCLDVLGGSSQLHPSFLWLKIHTSASSTASCAATESSMLVLQSAAVTRMESRGDHGHPKLRHHTHRPGGVPSDVADDAGPPSCCAAGTGPIFLGEFFNTYGGFQKLGYPEMDGLQGKIRLKLMIWGYPYFRKPTYNG